jgi:hypothetical protein
VAGLDSYYIRVFNCRLDLDMIRQRIVLDLETEPVTLQDAKDWLQMDMPDWDDVITMLIRASREQSEKVSGHAYGVKTFEVTGNQRDEKVYLTEPFIEDVEWEDEDGCKSYRYKAGFTTLPMDLKVAVLQRVATGFAYRQNGVGESVSMAVNQSIHIESKYSYLAV